MGKKSKANKVTVTAPEISEELAKEVAELKKQGNLSFAERDYLKALETYDAAIKKLPNGSVEKADIYSNRAACYIQMKKFKEATKECTMALNTCPGYTKALLRRSRAHEAQSMFRQALSDIQQINRSESSTEETKETERRLKDIIAGRRSPSSSKVALSNRTPPVLYFVAKCSFENEIRPIHLSHSTSYAELLEIVHVKFPNAKPCMIKYCDSEGDLITISDRSDINLAINEVLQAYERSLGSGSGGPRLPPQIPPIRLVLTKVDDENKVPVPPKEEIIERNQILASQKASERARKGKANDKKLENVEDSVFEIDDWLIDFANLFRERTGIDPDRHVDMHNLGVEKCQKALESSIHSKEALPIFEEAAEKFKEVTCVGLLNWGNVYLCVGHKIGSEAAMQGKDADEVEDKILEYFDKAEERYNQAMNFKPDFYDGVLAMAQLEFERAKIKIGLIIEPPMEPETEKEPSEKPEKSSEAKEIDVDEEKAQQDAVTAMNEAMKKALKRVKAEKLEIARPLIEKSWKLYERGVELGEELDKQREAEKQKDKEVDKSHSSKLQSTVTTTDTDSEKKETVALNGEASTLEKEVVEAVEQKKDGEIEAGAEGEGEVQQKKTIATKKENEEEMEEVSSDDPGLKTHALVMWGNVIFEQSQILAVTNGTWKESLDEAIAKFKEAGCNEKDINQALVTHIKSDELDIPKIEDEKSEKPESNVKGLPPLDSAKTKKTVD